MSAFYEVVGRLVVWFVRTRYRRQLRIAAGVGAAGLIGLVAAGWYVATRQPPEG